MCRKVKRNLVWLKNEWKLIFLKLWIVGVQKLYIFGFSKFMDVNLSSFSETFRTGFENILFKKINEKT